MYSPRESEPRRRRKDYDRDRDRERDLEASSPRSKPKERTRSTRTTQRTSTKDRERHASYSSSSSSSSQTYAAPKPAVKIQETDRRTSGGPLERSRSGLPYPSFSKAHSKESVIKSEESIRAKSSPYTPDPTDVSRERGASPRISKHRASHPGVPPSPPLTTFEPNLRRAGSGGSIGVSKARPLSSYETIGARSFEHLAPKDGLRFSASRSSLRDAEEGRSSSTVTPKSPGARSGTHKENEGSTRRGLGYRSPYGGSPTRKAQSRSSSNPQPSVNVTDSNTDSDATFIVPNQKREHNGQPPPTGRGGGSQAEQAYRHTNQGNSSTGGKQEPMIEVFESPDPELDRQQKEDEEGEYFDHNPSFPNAPPPPPPAFEPVGIPRVDYLLHNGGLPHLLPKAFAFAGQPSAAQRYQQYNSPQISGPNLPDLRTVFAPYQSLLDDFEKVLTKNGSVAVATGYRSVARRLLERLEAVFNRNISSEVCACVICRQDRQQVDSMLEDTGVSWGEMLELVSGRRELPPWPPFVLPTNCTTGLGISSDLEKLAPMQTLDVDVPEEYRDHYLRQSKKTKHAVQNWLASQPEDHTPPPTEVDDETLTFAMLTYLEHDQRRIFTALSRGYNSIPSSRAPTPAQSSEPKSDLMPRISLALQRLYRLPKPPRVPESSMYLLKNPLLHNALATLAAISPAEWDILTSGRFDGFLWSGAEDYSSTADTLASSMRSPSRGPQISHTGGSVPPNLASRTTTPFSPGGVPLPHRGTTPFNSTGNGASPAVQMDEETEIAVLAEVERDIYLGMEALEDAFERLHLKAEGVRQALRARGAGLAVSAQARRGSNDGGADEGVGVRLATPNLGPPNANGSAAAASWPHYHQQTHKHQPPFPFAPTPSPAPPTDDWLLDSDAISLAPDDSASNIGWKERERRVRERHGGGGGSVGVKDSGGAGGAVGRGFVKRLRKRTVDVLREEG